MTRKRVTLHNPHASVNVYCGQTWKHRYSISKMYRIL